MTAPKPTPLTPPILAQAQDLPAPPPRLSVGNALIGGELVALAVQVGKLAVGTKIKGNLLLQVPKRRGRELKEQLGTPQPDSGQHRKARSGGRGPLGGWALLPITWGPSQQEPLPPCPRLPGRLPITTSPGEPSSRQLWGRWRHGLAAATQPPRT